MMSQEPSIPPIEPEIPAPEVQEPEAQAIEPQVYEPSVLDFLKSRLAFWRPGPRIELPSLPAKDLPFRDEQDDNQPQPRLSPTYPRPQPTPRLPRQPLQVPWLALMVLFFAVTAQLLLEPRPDRSWNIGLVFYLAAAGLAVLAWRKSDLALPEIAAESNFFANQPVRLIPLLSALVLGSLAFVLFGEYQFNQLNVAIWLGALASLTLAFWRPPTQAFIFFQKTKQILSQTNWSIHVNGHTLALAAALMIGLVFLTLDIRQNPGEMISEHAEKLMDVNAVWNGTAQTGFPRNIGNEFLQVYLTSIVAALLHTGISFLSLKAGTLLCGFLTLPFIYLLGKEIGNQRVGLLALAFASIAYWPNVISRSGFSFVLYPFFFAPALYFLLLGLRSSASADNPGLNNGNRNAFILAGVCLGLGLNGYSAFQIVPLIFMVGIGLYILHQRSRQALQNALTGLAISFLFALIVCLPALRFTLKYQDTFVFLSLFRLGSPLPPLTTNPLVAFFSNLWHALLMFSWDNGDIWVLAIPRRPVLDFVTGALFHLGALFLLMRYWRKHRWQDLFVLLSIPMLLLPSILALAYPAENPALNRGAGALIPTFLLVGLALDGIMHSIEKRMSFGGARLAGILALGLFTIASLQNFTLIFSQFAEAHSRSSWNTSEIGEVVRSFADLAGTPENAWLVAYPYWVDSRLVMINAGFPERDNAILPDQISKTTADPRQKLFILNTQDAISLSNLRNLYPQGWLQTYVSQKPTKDFWLYFVPAVVTNAASPQTTR